MSLTADQQISVCKILSIQPYVLTAQLAWLGSRLTSAMETSIIADIASWDGGVGNDFTDIHPNDKNFGASIKADRARNNLRQQIAVLLERPDWAGGSGQVSMVRG